MADLEIFVAILGDVPASEKMFPVTALASDSVGKWRRAVRTETEKFEGLHAADLTLWKLKKSIPSDGVDKEVPASVETLDAVAEKMLPSKRLSHYFAAPPAEDSLHVIVELPKRSLKLGSKRRRVDDAIDEALQPPSKLQVKTEAPSRAGAASKFRVLVEDPRVGILCNRPMNDTTIPLTLLHPIFGQFVKDCGSFKPGPEEHAFTRELSRMAGFFESEMKRREFFNTTFAKYYRIFLKTEEVPGTNRPTDGHAYIRDPKSPKNQYIFVIAEGKNEITNNAADPRFQAVLYYRDYAQTFFRPTFQTSCLPAILLTYYAASFQVSGVVTHPNGAVQSTVLTVTFPLDADWRDDDSWTRLAQCLGALKNCFKALSTYYQSLPDPSPEIFQNDYPSMNFPYPGECEDIAFHYIARVYPDRLIFLAEDNADPQRSLFIKFSKEYSVDAHRSLAESGNAPKLYASSQLPGGWFMVAMEEMKKPWMVLRDIGFQNRTQFREAIEKAIEALHAKGYVHGDIRESNVFVCPNDLSLGIRIIDFDEAGLDGIATYPRNLNTESVDRPPGAFDGEIITKEHDKFMMEKLFPYTDRDSRYSRARSIVGLRSYQ